jgi:hypothetical protein
VWIVPGEHKLVLIKVDDSFCSAIFPTKAYISRLKKTTPVSADAFVITRI